MFKYEKARFLFVTIIFFALLIFLISINIHIGVYEQYTATVESNTVIIDGEYNILSEKVYLYINDNSIPVKILSLWTKNGSTHMILENFEHYRKDIDMQLQVDISLNELSLFELIFIRGGKSNAR